MKGIDVDDGKVGWKPNERDRINGTPPSEIIIYVCPTPGCGDYYASPNFHPSNPDLSAPQSQRSTEDGTVRATHSRLSCPICRQTRGLAVDRVPYVVVTMVPLRIVMADNHQPEE